MNYYLEHYVGEKVIREITAVLVHGDNKHPGEEWKKTAERIHRQHAINHINAYLDWDEDDVEIESGCHHLAHAIVRLMFALAIEMGETK